MRRGSQLACAAACWGQPSDYAPQPLQYLDCADDIKGRLLHCKNVRPTDAAWRAWGIKVTPRDAANFTLHHDSQYRQQQQSWASC